MSPTLAKRWPSLRRQEVDDVEALGLCLKQSGRGRQEMNVRVGGYPTFRAEVLIARDLQSQLALARFDPEPAADRLVLESLADLDQYLADRQLDLKGAVHIRERRLL